MRIIENVKIINVIKLNPPEPHRWTIEIEVPAFNATSPEHYELVKMSFDIEFNEPHPYEWTIETDHIEVPAFNATSPERHELVKMFFDSELADSYSILVNENNNIMGITPSGSKVETQWRESFSIEP